MRAEREGGGRRGRADGARRPALDLADAQRDFRTRASSEQRFSVPVRARRLASASFLGAAVRPVPPAQLAGFAGIDGPRPRRAPHACLCLLSSAGTVSFLVQSAKLHAVNWNAHRAGARTLVTNQAVSGTQARRFESRKLVGSLRHPIVEADNQPQMLQSRLGVYQ